MADKEAAAVAAQQKAFNDVRSEIEALRKHFDPRGEGIVSRDELPSFSARAGAAETIEKLKDMTVESAEESGFNLALDHAVKARAASAHPHAKLDMNKVVEMSGRYAAALLSDDMRKVIENLPTVELGPEERHFPTNKVGASAEPIPTGSYLNPQFLPNYQQEPKSVFHRT